jgi:peptide/nickel transport system permease protein
VTTYVLRRLLHVPLPLFLVLVVVFFAIRLSGDPVALMLADYATEQQKQQLRHSLGLDQPLPVQFAIYVSSVVRGDFGESVVYNQPAAAVVATALPATVQLTLLAITVATVVGIGTGLLRLARQAAGFVLRGADRPVVRRGQRRRLSARPTLR